MRIINVFILLALSSCDTIAIKHRVGQCLSWRFSDSVYKTTMIDGLNIETINLANNSKKIFSKLDSGWEIVDCPKE